MALAAAPSVRLEPTAVEVRPPPADLGSSLMQGPFSIAPLRLGDRSAVMCAVGPTIDTLYPRGAAKLSARLDEVADRRAHCWIAWSSGRLAGISVDTPKGPKAAKLSTLWVAPSFRRAGVGSALVDTTLATWRARDVERGHLTVRRTQAEPLVALLAHHGFAQAGIAVHKYGLDEDELVLLWSNNAVGQVSRSNPNHLLRPAA
jgi:ribosomal protein S18 acetylase RimI-like enzyme